MCRRRCHTCRPRTVWSSTPFASTRSRVLRTDLAGAIAAHGDVIDPALRKLMTLPHVHLISVESADFYGMLNSIRLYGLLPRDALHVTIMQRLGLTAIASDDTDFDRVATLTCHWVINPPAGA